MVLVHGPGEVRGPDGFFGAVCGVVGVREVVGVVDGAVAAEIGGVRLGYGGQSVV